MKKILGYIALAGIAIWFYSEYKKSKEKVKVKIQTK